MQNRTRKKINAPAWQPAWQIEYANAYKKYLKDFKSLRLKNYEPISFREFTIFHTWQELMKEEKIGNRKPDKAKKGQTWQ